VLDTSPELQHEFCALWNQVFTADVIYLWYVLRPIRNIYLTLHLHTDSAPTAFSPSTDDEDVIFRSTPTYPLCNIPSHHPDSTPHIHDATTPTAIAHADLHDNVALVPSSLSSTPDAPSLSVPTPVRIDENAVDDPLLNSDMPAPASSHSAHQLAAENVSDSATSPDPSAAAAAARDTDTSARTMTRTAPEVLTSAASVFSTGEHSLQNISGLLIHPDAPEIPSQTFPEPVLDDITGSSMSLTLS
jgi:hypothetical protein